MQTQFPINMATLTSCLTTLKIKHADITPLVAKAVGQALAENANMCGHIVFGSFYFSPNPDQVSVSVLVDATDNETVPILLPLVNLKPVAHVSEELINLTKTVVDRLEAGKLTLKEKILAVAENIPFMPLVVDAAFDFIGCGLGLTVKPLGIVGHPFGDCIIVPSGYNDNTFHFTVASRRGGLSSVPIVVTIGADTVAVAIDSCAASAMEARHFTTRLQELLNDPASLETQK